MSERLRRRGVDTAWLRDDPPAAAPAAAESLAEAEGDDGKGTEGERECSICAESLAEAEFQFGGVEQAVTAGCTHARTVCRSCLSRTIGMEVNGKGNSTRILCPHDVCDQELAYEDVKREACEKDFLRYDELLLRSVLQQEPSFRWCSGQRCGNGQLVEGLQDEGRNMNMTCRECQAKTCCWHRCPWHSGRSCAQYDQDAKASDEVALLQYLEREGTVRCPKCHHAIQKVDGCDHMVCRREASGCGAEFCWRCGADYLGPTGIWAVGNHAHLRACTHWRPGRGEHGGGESDHEIDEEDSEVSESGDGAD